jgi:hypothetical protein
MGCCIAKAHDKTPLQQDQDRFSAIQAPDQPMRQITYLDADGKEQHYWARHDEQLRTQGRSIMKRQNATKLA